MQARFLYPLLLLISSFCTQKQEGSGENIENDVLQEHPLPVTIDESFGDFSLRLDLADRYYILSFSRYDSAYSYQSIRYTASFDSIRYLQEEIETIDKLYNIARDSIIIDLKYAIVGHPLLYHDILKHHIEAVLSDSTPSNTDLRQVMVNNDVYHPLNEWLKTKGFRITGISTEKHGRVPKEDLIRLGYSGTENIPVPFMVWLEIGKNH